MVYAIEHVKMSDLIVNEELLDDNLEFFLRPLIRR
jgi:hypothetical protein